MESTIEEFTEELVEEERRYALNIPTREEKLIHGDA